MLYFGKTWPWLQPVPAKKMRLEMVLRMQIEILRGVGFFLSRVNYKNTGSSETDKVFAQFLSRS